MAEGHGITAHHLGHHGVLGDGLFEVVVLDQAQALERHRVELRRAADLVLVEVGEGLEDLLQEATLDALALEAQVAHGFEECILLGVAGRAVGHLEEGVVRVVEQRLQRLLELLCSLVAHLDECHGQPSYRRSWRLLGGALERHHVRVGLHSESPAADHLDRGFGLLSYVEGSLQRQASGVK